MDEKKKISLFTKSFLIISIINMLLFFGFQITNVGMPIYVASLGANDIIVGLVTTLVTVASIIFRPLSGVILDRMNRKLILLASITVMVIVTAGYVVFPIVGLILVFRLFQGVGYSISDTATSVMVADDIPKERFAEGMGYFTIIAALSAAVAPVLAVSLMEGSRAMLMISLAAGGFAAGLILTLFYKSGKKKSKEEVQEVKSLERLRVSNLIDKRAILPAGTVALMAIGFGAVVTFIALHSIEQGIENTFLFFIAYAVSTMICRPFLGRIVDKIGFFIPGIVATLGAALCLVLTSFSTSVLMLCISGAVAGIGFNAGMATMQTMAVSALPSEKRGVAMSTYLLGWDSGVGIGALTGGIIAGFFDYITMYRAMAIFPLIGFIIFICTGKSKIARYQKSDLSDK